MECLFFYSFQYPLLWASKLLARTIKITMNIKNFSWCWEDQHIFCFQIRPTRMRFRPPTTTGGHLIFKTFNYYFFKRLFWPKNVVFCCCCYFFLQIWKTAWIWIQPQNAVENRNCGLLLRGWYVVWELQVSVLYWWPPVSKIKLWV